eukprot:CAMPEP_0185300060 /NCGR_PEP_ID=MMETSP1363-20130426/11740_1 /TAXON_ID=38817 /ORGANISM="Gephyrocapsa oceanica, Strain RCC1303" /LENGTH=150 /DNA_ID=CAMNT_0027896995 /DNA_START=289 /DNA_END=741 /DNA_ORIENTATION=-
MATHDRAERGRVRDTRRSRALTAPAARAAQALLHLPRRHGAFRVPPCGSAVRPAAVRGAKRAAAREGGPRVRGRAAAAGGAAPPPHRRLHPRAAAILRRNLGRHGALPRQHPGALVGPRPVPQPRLAPRGWLPGRAVGADLGGGKTIRIL